MESRRTLRRFVRGGLCLSSPFGVEVPDGEENAAGVVGAGLGWVDGHPNKLDLGRSCVGQVLSVM